MKFTINLPGYSINSMYYNDKRLGKRTDAKEWSYQVNWEIDKFAKEFMELRQQFDPKRHGLRVDLTFHYKNFYNAQQKISSKVHDLSNVEKPLLDLLLTKANHGPAPYKAQNLAIDDKYVIELNSKKRPAAKDSIDVEIYIIDLP